MTTIAIESERAIDGAVDVEDDAVDESHPVAALHSVTSPTVALERIDRARAQNAVTELLLALGRDPFSADLTETPRRVVDAFAEQLAPQDFAPTNFANSEHYDELVLVRDIPFHSLCEHHLLPFHGVAHVGYLQATD